MGHAYRATIWIAQLTIAASQGCGGETLGPADSQSATRDASNTRDGEREEPFETHPPETANEATGGRADGPSLVACMSFLEIWRTRQAELGNDETPPEGADSPCYACTVSASCTPADPAKCSDKSACVYRHCLCAPDGGADARCAGNQESNDLCACLPDCFSIGGDACLAQWSAYVECLAEECASACGH